MIYGKSYKPETLQPGLDDDWVLVVPHVLHGHSVGGIRGTENDKFDYKLRSNPRKHGKKPFVEWCRAIRNTKD